MFRGVAGVVAAALVAALITAVPASADAPYSRVEFEQTWIDVDEGNDLIVVKVVRDQPLLATEGRVDFETEAVEATEDADYQGAWGTLVFAPGQDERSIVVRVRDDDEAEGVEAFRLILWNPRGSIDSVGTPATVWIVDDESASVAPATVGVQASEHLSDPATRVVVRKRVTTVRRRVPRVTRVAAPVQPPTVPLEIVPGPSGTVRSSPVPLLGAFAAVLLGRVLATFWLRRRLFAAVPSRPPSWPEPPPLS